MLLSNRFKEEDKLRVWEHHPYCALCDLNINCSLHHIYGCKHDGTDSILNSIMLCEYHHRIADGHNRFQEGDDRRVEYLAYVIKQAIAKNDYVLVDRDYRFLEQIPVDFQNARNMLL